ncbi:hypothetical protein HYH02_000807 [Chlamydomonas schloesseri]|uniref:Uncharacterized protein n=1 Tax=Chlamydomonas schloesseri TaxID=2026947 RepID=A0A835WYN0_9CHLO|nr:hypothetical protein HYH02_000807 [Chlamydomonas schloesseri]|eukprot:KAG2454981.1 hypothetical protein HYH02_000807 [Chlamydomonas schloesseri]
MARSISSGSALGRLVQWVCHEASSLGQGPSQQLLAVQGRCGSGAGVGALSSSHGLPSGGPGALLALRQAPPLLQQLRAMGTGTAGVEPKVLRKARKLAVAVGSLAGVFGSLVGVGGGVLISPIIANACKTIPQRVISGTSLAAVAATGSAAGYVYYTCGAVDLTSAALIAVAAVVTAPLGARATKVFDCAMLRRLMAYWLFIVAPLVPLKPYLLKTYAGKGPDGDGDGGGGGEVTAGGADAATASVGAAPSAAAVASGGGAAEKPLWRPLRNSDAVLVATGTIAGFASGLLGIGGGTIVTPLLTIATGLPQLSVLGTSLAAMVLPSVIGLAQHARLGNVDVLMAAGLVLGTTLGSSAGSRLALELPDGVLEWMFCLGMMYLGRKTLAGARATAPAGAGAAAGAGAGAKTPQGAAGAAAAVGGGPPPSAPKA